jgi:hypothetical protein
MAVTPWFYWKVIESNLALPASESTCVNTILKKEAKSGTTPHPRRASASALRAGRNDRGQRPATPDAGGSTRGDRARRTSPEVNNHEFAGTASLATEAPTKRIKSARAEHTACRRERGQPCRKEKESRSQGMQCA